MSMVGKQADAAAPGRDVARSGRGRFRRPAVLGLLVAGLAAAGVAGVGMMTGDGQAPSSSATVPADNTATLAGTSSGSRLMAYDLDRLVAEADRIVVGTVGDVQHGAASDTSGGMDYVLGTIEVEEMIRGPQAQQIVAFDFDYGNSVVSDSFMGATFERGQRVLVFLTSVAGTVSENLRPKHWQVTGGGQGQFFFDGDKLQAPFSIDEVRAAVDGPGNADQQSA